MAPKHLHCDVKTIEISVYLATGVFNEGFNSILKTMTVIGIIIGLQAKLFADRYSQRLNIKATKQAQMAERSGITSIL